MQACPSSFLVSSFSRNNITVNPYCPTKLAKEHFGILLPVYNSRSKLETRSCHSRWHLLCWHKDSAGLPNSAVRGQLATCFHLQTQAITCSDEGELSKANSLLAINIWNQVGGFAAQDVSCCAQETKVCLACQALLTVLIRLSQCNPISCNLITSFASKVLQRRGSYVPVSSNDSHSHLSKGFW